MYWEIVSVQGFLLVTMNVGMVYSSYKSVIAVLSQRGDGSIPAQQSICKHNACSRQLSFRARPPAAHRLPCLVCNAARQSVSVEVCTLVPCCPVCHVSFLACSVTLTFLWLSIALGDMFLKGFCFEQELQQQKGREADISHSNVVTLGKQRLRNKGHDQSHTAQMHNQQQVCTCS